MKRKILKNIMAITAMSIMLSGCQSSQEESGTPDMLRHSVSDFRQAEYITYGRKGFV